MGTYFDKPGNFTIHPQSAQKLTSGAKIMKISAFSSADVHELPHCTILSRKAINKKESLPNELPAQNGIMAFILVVYILLRYVYIWYLSNTYLRSQLRIYWCYYYSLCSQTCFIFSVQKHVVNRENKSSTNKFIYYYLYFG
jgi:hypothetical protein